MFGQKGLGACLNNGSERITNLADIVTIHPAKNNDCRSKNQLTGTVSLRQSMPDIDVDLSLSLVMRGPRVNKKERSEHFECKEVEVDGNDAQFRYLDFKAASKGEYCWLLLHFCAGCWYPTCCIHRCPMTNPVLGLLLKQNEFRKLPSHLSKE
jgi:hypothetical protein